MALGYFPWVAPNVFPKVPILRLGIIARETPLPVEDNVTGLVNARLVPMNYIQMFRVY
jgi:hypothetical protein